MGKHNINDYRKGNASKSNKKRFGDRSYIYVLHCEGTDFYKIGVSNKPERRISDISKSMPFDIATLLVVKSHDAYGIEQTLHAKISEHYVKSEWFKLSPKQVTEVILHITEINVCQGEIHYTQQKLPI